MIEQPRVHPDIADKVIRRVLGDIEDLEDEQRDGSFVEQLLEDRARLLEEVFDD